MTLQHNRLEYNIFIYIVKIENWINFFLKEKFQIIFWNNFDVQEKMLYNEW